MTIDAVLRLLLVLELPMMQKLCLHASILWLLMCKEPVTPAALLELHGPAVRSAVAGHAAVGTSPGLFCWNLVPLGL